MLRCQVHCVFKRLWPWTLFFVLLLTRLLLRNYFDVNQISNMAFVIQRITSRYFFRHIYRKSSAGALSNWPQLGILNPYSQVLYKRFPKFYWKRHKAWSDCFSNLSNMTSRLPDTLITCMISFYLEFQFVVVYPRGSFKSWMTSQPLLDDLRDRPVSWDFRQNVVRVSTRPVYIELTWHAFPIARLNGSYRLCGRIWLK